MTVEHLMSLKNKGANLRLIDVREPSELAQTGKIENAVNIPLGEIVSAFSLDDSSFKNKYEMEKPQKYASNVIFYCKGGVRSMKAIQNLIDMGYK
ncbi:Thiosulfate:glutathione sulfurtransferase, partial [Cichlidogyrus casuarinus]